MKRPNWLTYDQEKEIRKTLSTSKLQACKDLLELSKTANIGRDYFGLKDAKDYVDNLSSFKDPYIELTDALDTIEKLEESLESLLKDILPNATDEKILELLADKNRMKQLATTGITSSKFGL